MSCGCNRKTVRSAKGGYRSAKGGYRSAKSGYRSAKGGYRSAKGGYRSAKGGYRSAKGGYRSAKGGYRSAKGGYRPTQRDLLYLRRYRQGKSIGFTMRSSLKAKGLIPRANGTKRVSNKYKYKGG